MRDALWVGKRRRHEKTEWKQNTDNQKPEVRTAATLVLVREGLELEYCSGNNIQIVYSVQNIIHKTVDSSISKIYYIQYNMFNNNEHSILHMISETLISSVIQLKLDILLMKLQSYKARNSSTE